MSRRVVGDRIGRDSQVATQIAIALENATAFDEIAALKEQLARAESGRGTR
jgi:GAF domain-containing protein